MIEPKYDLVEKAGGGEARYVGLVATRFNKPLGGAARVVVHVLPQMLDYVADPAALKILQPGLSLHEARAAGLALVIQRAAADLAWIATQRSVQAPLGSRESVASARAATATAGAAQVAQVE